MSQNSYKEENVLKGIKSFTKTQKDYTLHYSSGETAKIWIINNHVFRYYMSPTGVFSDYPIPNNKSDVATISIKSIDDYDTEAFENSFIEEHEHTTILHTPEIKIIFNNLQGTFTVHDKMYNIGVLEEKTPIRYSDEKTTQTMIQHKDEYFFGGGMQNGRFSHKGESIHIKNTNDWVDRGVTSPNPYYWSSYGYGVLRNTWKSGFYDFGVHKSDIIELYHKENHIDAFYFINKHPRHILSDYYELTGQPIAMPEYAFYEAHLNTFNRDYWVEVDSNVPEAILFEDGKYYKQYKPKEMDGKKGILESLNGEKNNYQFSARAMIDRYKNKDIPLGWFIPNDGYGSGYGQTDSLEGDIKNLEKFVDYANKQGVEVALWTESNLEPKDPEHPKKGERDLSKEVSIGIVALKCDVAWIGEGYSFGLNAVKHATDIFIDRVKTRVRPLIIMVDGWAGTQRYAGIWSGDQNGGEWEYIRFHIPTYIGAGLSGLPIIGSDMDGIYEGGDKEVNIRDYQWKAFTPLQLNMDGWGKVQKTPFTFGPEATAINRAYLKLKSMLLPYNYTTAHESVYGLPMVRAMFLAFPKEEPAYTKDSQYQYMWGPYILVAPVYKKTQQLVRDLVYLPDQELVWIDFFTGQKYQGGKIYNNLKAPLWKIPVFVPEGAIIPSVNDNNNPNEVIRDFRTYTVYPNGSSEFEVYEDDGKSKEYLEGQFAETKVSSLGPKANKIGDLHIRIHKTKGQYKNFIKERTTLIRIKTSRQIEHVKAAINGETIELYKSTTREEFDKDKKNVYYFDQKFLINPYLETLGTNDELHQKFLLIKIQKTDITETEIHIKVANYTNKGDTFGSNDNVNHNLMGPRYFTVIEEEISTTSMVLQWEENEYASYYEIQRDGVIFSNILGETFKFEDFKCESEHSFKIRSVNDKGVSKWSYTIIAKTNESPFKNTVQGVTATCNIPCEPQQEICNLVDCDMNSLWHTDWNKPGEADTKKGNIITLSFDLRDVYDIDTIKYIPREDLGNGTFLKIQYRHSIDGESWGKLSSVINWKENEDPKIINLNGARMKFFELNVLDSVSGFGSGRALLFYKNL